MIFLLFLLSTKNSEGEKTSKSLQTDYFSSEFSPIFQKPIKKVYSSAGYEEVMKWINHWADFYDYPDIKKAEMIVSCEGGFDEPTICNKAFGCSGGQGHFQIIPSTWINLQKIGVENVFDTSDNIQAGIYLLKTGGDTHWGTADTWWGSYRCWKPKL